MASGTIDGKYYDNIPTPEDWGKAQGELADLQRQLQQAQGELLVAKRNAESWQETAQQAQAQIGDMAVELTDMRREGDAAIERHRLDAGRAWQFWNTQVVVTAADNTVMRREAIERGEAAEALAIRGFVERVNRRAETEMMETGTLEGAHHRAIQAELATLLPAEAQAQREDNDG